MAKKRLWVPKDVRWKVLMAKLKIVDLSILIDNALDLIEKGNLSLNDWYIGKELLCLQGLSWHKAWRTYGSDR